MAIKKTLYVTVPFGLLLTAYVLIIHSFFDISKVTLIKFMLSQLFVIMMPGLVCTKYFIGDKDTSIVHWISLSYVFGYAVNIIEYIAIWGARLQKYAAHIVCLVALLMLFFWFYKPIDIQFKEVCQNDYVLIFIFMSFMMINIIAYSGNNISPLIRQGVTNIPRDMQFWCSNAVSLKNSFLPQAAYFSGTTLFYHYFSSMHIAFLSQITDISVFDLAFTLYSFGKCVLLIGALNYLIDRYHFGYIKYLFYVFILFMTGWETKTLVTYGWHINYNPFGFDIGFAFGIWLVVFILELAEKQEFDLRQFFSIILIWMALTGLKGPIAVILILVPGIFCLIWLLEKRYKMAFGYGLAFIGVFVTVNVFFVGIIRILNHTAEAPSDNVGGFRTIYEVISATPFEARYRFFLPSLIWYAFNVHPALFVVTAINFLFLICMLLSKKIQIKNVVTILVLLCVTVLGMFAGLFYKAVGHSEMYFTMAAYIPCLAFNLEAYRMLLDNGLLEIKWRDIAYKTAIILMSIVGLYCWGFTDYLGGVISPLNTGYKKISESWEYTAGSGIFSLREADACEWLRENTPNDSIIQSNRYLSYPAGNYFVGIFTERVQYLEESNMSYYCDLGIEGEKSESQEVARRSDIIADAFDGNMEAIEKLREEGVDYLLQDNYLSEDKLVNAGLKQVYDKDDIVIYRFE